MKIALVVSIVCIFAGIQLLLLGHKELARRITIQRRLGAGQPQPNGNQNGFEQAFINFRAFYKPLGGVITRFTPPRYWDHLQTLIDQSGYRWLLLPHDLAVVQIILGGAGMLIGITLSRLGDVSTLLGLTVILALAGIGVLIPITTLNRIAQKRRRQIRNRFPDFLDLVTLSISAGIAFDAALREVAELIAGPLAEEVNYVLTAISLGESREQALEDTHRRLNIPEVSDFVLAINHATQVGASISPVLQQQAQSTRVRHRQITNEQINRLPVKILLPTAFLILPATLIIILGPSVSEITRMFS